MYPSSFVYSKWLSSMASKAKRDQIVALKEAGLTTMQVMKKANVCRKTVYNVMKRYKETGNTTSKPIPGRKRSVRTKRNVERVKKRVQRNPRRSMRATAKEVNISRTSLRRIVKQDLGLKALKMQHRQLISAASKKKRLDRGKMMLQEIQSATDKVMVWSDEKMFTVQAVVNSQNDRVYAHSAQHLPEGCRTHFHRQNPAGVMVWAAVASDGSKSPLVFIQEGVKVNSQVYLQMLEEKVLPWCTNAFGNQYVFTQDGAPAHTSNITQAWCKQHFPGFWDKNMWPPSSPDINPMEFAIWSILERDVSRVSHSSVTALKTALMKSWQRQLVNCPARSRSCWGKKGIKKKKKKKSMRTTC
uniref:Paired domain-containing protein n=1 Tax=Amphiprion percula TaxID=161767 RepID=A0A3P8TI71_AMPPE